MRGTVLHRRVRLVGVRFIPAHAGNRPRQQWHGQSCAVHPRACGEQTVKAVRSCAAIGSSPRMRGTVVHHQEYLHYIRFIPAHAGNSKSPFSLASRIPVHPRACGEQSGESTWLNRYSGSSPRMRGTDAAGRRLVCRHRFIPAHAGNSPSLVSGAGAGRVHPRACGEQERQMRRMWQYVGSSPRMRGTVSRHTRHGQLRRFIPAHAGNRIPPPICIVAAPVHPRACGEQPWSSNQACASSGSSPRMRGTVHPLHGVPRRHRFIPAHAGNRANLWQPARNPPVHPRACGEQK